MRKSGQAEDSLAGRVTSPKNHIYADTRPRGADVNLSVKLQ